MQLLKFPIVLELEDKKYKVFFKPTGKPNVASLHVLDFKTKQKLGVHEFKLPKEVPSWQALAKDVMRKALVRRDEKPDEIEEDTVNEKPTKNSDEDMSDSGTPKGVQRDSLRQYSPGLLSHLSAAGIPAVEDILKSKAVFAKDLSAYELYLTVPAKEKEHLRASYHMARFEGLSNYNPGTGKKYVNVIYYAPFPLKEWRRIVVPEDTLFRVFPDGPQKEKQMSTKKVKEDKEAPAKKEKGLGVFEAWGQAFEKFGRAKDAPEKIVAFMEKSFPGKKTKWAKWVNVQRNVYNRGGHPGTKKPSERIQVYKSEAASKKSAKAEKPAKAKKQKELVEA